MSERIARRADQHAALGMTDTRGARFAQVWTGAKGPDFTDMAAVPRWLLLTENEQKRVAQVTGLMKHRAAIERELSGPRLAMLAEAMGEDLLDAVCASDFTEDLQSNATLPRPDMIVADGWDVMHRGLPTVLASRFSDASGDPKARALSEKAFDLVRAL